MIVKTTPEFFELLNKGVSRELQVSVQYMLQHSKMEKLLRRVIPENMLLDKTTYDQVGKVLHDFAIQEMKHAAAIMERIYLLGGTATTKSDKVKIGDSLKEFGKLDQKAEEEALDLYRKTIEMAGSLGDWETREMFEHIYGDEEKHLIRFQEYNEIEDEPDLGTTEGSEFEKIYADDWIAMLNKALASEISAIIQYTNQHEKANVEQNRRRKSALEVVADKTKPISFSDLARSIAMDEMKHMEKIAERIYEIKKECSAAVDPVPNVGDTVDNWILNDRVAENSAITFYRQIIAKAIEIGDVRTRKIFEDIINQEEEHYWKFDEWVP